LRWTGEALIGERLIQGSTITVEQLNEALQQQQKTGAKIVATLITLGHLAG